MIITTTQSITGKDFKEITVVKGTGCAVKYERGYLSDFHKDIESAREACFQKMAEQALKYNADGIIDVKYEIQEVSNAIIFFVYGTAVKFIDAYVVSKK
ncbi:heavy metal-binding domain-containing protein [Thomasclavelia cocleata]|uniref:heavy metal-binding domain-containing protein n=1 Tax=Thomasclavelia cocleata TaxID=69824 RepID=UPI00256F325E|nr:heavy metal-binding domain-containing protein [Thomasclavelia cocleata]